MPGSGVPKSLLCIDLGAPRCNRVGQIDSSVLRACYADTSLLFDRPIRNDAVPALADRSAAA